MDIQRLRNLTTSILHTEMSHIYIDLEHLTGQTGIMTHHIPAALRALKPVLQKREMPSRFWNGQYDTTHIGEIDIAPLSKIELTEFWALFSQESCR